AAARAVRGRGAGRRLAAALGGRISRARRCRGRRRFRAARSVAHLSETRSGPRRATLKRMRCPAKSRVSANRLWNTSHTFVTPIPSEPDQTETCSPQACQGTVPRRGLPRRALLGHGDFCGEGGVRDDEIAVRRKRPAAAVL